MYRPLGRHLAWPVLAVSLLLGLLPVHAGTFGAAFVPNMTGGIRISCANPDRVLGAVRTERATTVFQAAPDGVRWQVALPPVTAEFDYFWFAPDGSAAVVGLSVGRGGRAYLVSGGGEPIEINGSVMAADFQPGRVLVATDVFDGKQRVGTRVRVYAIDSGVLIGDSVFEDELAFTVTHDAYKQFNLRLSADGRAYYYIRWTASAGDELVVRQVRDGSLRAVHDNFPAPAPVTNNTMANVAIHDALLYADRGYVIAAGELYALDDGALRAIQTPKALGGPVRLLESADRARQVVVGSQAWGVLDTTDGGWTVIGRDGYAHLQSGAAGVTVVDLSRNTPGIRTWEFAGVHPDLIRASGADEPSRASLLCANAYGFMSYRDGKLQWHRTMALD